MTAPNSPFFSFLSDRQTIGRNFVEIYPGSRADYYSAIASVSRDTSTISCERDRHLQNVIPIDIAATMAGTTATGFGVE